jgi:hypothetical protein
MSGYVDIKLDKTYMEKLDSWDKKMALSVRKSKKRVP